MPSVVLRSTATAITRQAHASGTVTVQVTIDENGSVVSSVAVSGHPLTHGGAYRDAILGYLRDREAGSYAILTSKFLIEHGMSQEINRMSTEVIKAVIELKGDDLFVGNTSSGNVVTIDTDRVRHSAPSPMELLLLALGACTGVDVISILRKKRQDVTDYRIEVRGQRRDDHPRSYELVEVHHIVTGRNMSPQSVTQAIELSEKKYCSVAATMRQAAEIASSFEIIEA
jgi:putative redox protein